MSENIVVTTASIACGHCDICGGELYRSLMESNVSMRFDTPTYKANWCMDCTGKAYALLAALVKGRETTNA